MKRDNLLKALDEELLPRGFERQGATWNRRADSFVDVVDVQKGRATPEFTINVGVLERDLFATFWGHEPDPFVLEPFCPIRSRIGMLTPGRPDLWWNLAETDSIDKMRKCLLEFGIPFIEGLHSLQGMADWLASPSVVSPWSGYEAYFYAIVLHRLGKTEQACSALADLQARRVGTWKDKASSLAEQFGCQSRRKR